MDTSYSVNHPLCAHAPPSCRLDGPEPHLLANRWLVIAQDGTICAVRAHLYSVQRAGFDPQAFLRSRARSDWRIAREFPAPEFHIDRLAIELELGPERTAARFPPGPPISAQHWRFWKDPELMFGDAMSRLIMDLPDGLFVEGHQPYFYYSSVMIRPADEDGELSFLDRRDPRYPDCVLRAPFTLGP